MSRRTIGDAIEVLRSDPKFSQDMRATIRVAPLRLPSGDLPFLLVVVCEDVGLAVSLPSSKKFRAKLAHSPTALKPEEWETPLLEEAIVKIIDDQVQVILSDGRRLRRVEIVPYKMPPHLDRPRDVQSRRLQNAVIAHIVGGVNNAEDRCYRYIDKKLLPGFRVLDLSTLHVLRLPSLSAIMHDIELNNEELNGISRQTAAECTSETGAFVCQNASGRQGKSA